MLADLLQPTGMTQNAIARAIGVPPCRINGIVQRKRTAIADTDLRLAKYLGLSEAFGSIVSLTMT